MLCEVAALRSKMTSIVHLIRMAQLTYNDILTLLSIIAVAMLVILLYHLIFVSVALRRISERMESLSQDVESVILKPIGAVEYLVDWFISAIEGMQHGKKKKEEGHHKK